MPATVQRRRDAPKGVAPAAEVRNLSQRGLLGGVRLQVPLVGRQSVAELDVAHALAVAALVPQGVTGAHSHYDPELDRVVRSVHQILPRAEIPLGRLDGGMTE